MPVVISSFKDLYENVFPYRLYPRLVSVIRSRLFWEPPTFTFDTLTGFCVSPYLHQIQYHLLWRPKNPFLLYILICHLSFQKSNPISIHPFTFPVLNISRNIANPLSAHPVIFLGLKVNWKLVKKSPKPKSTFPLSPLALRSSTFLCIKCQITVWFSACRWIEAIGN